MEDDDAESWEIDPEDEYQLHIVAFGHDKPHLSSAKRRVGRAVELLNDLLPLVQDFEESAMVHVVIDRRRPDEFETDWSGAKVPSLGRTGLLAGEIVYHLRAALDYLSMRSLGSTRPALTRGRSFQSTRRKTRSSSDGATG